jgi:hypothetical protein
MRRARPTTKSDETPEFQVRKAKALPSQGYLIESFNYDPGSGELTWKHRPDHHFKDEQLGSSWVANLVNSRFAGRPAFSVNTHGHLRGGLNGQRVYAHRIIWKIVHGDEPRIIDHIDGNPLNNRITNLRSVTHRENSQNMKMNRSNSTGVTGVYRHAKGGFNSRISDPSGVTRTKYFRDFDDAVEWRAAREIEFGYLRREAA